MPRQKSVDLNGDCGGSSAKRFARVDAMFLLPVEKRWEIAKTFTKEEREYSVKVQKRMLYAEARAAMDGGEDETWMPADTLGDSDDGTI